MQLTTEQLDTLHRHGFLVIEGLFDRDETRRLRARLPALFAEDTPDNIREKTSGERDRSAAPARPEPRRRIP